MVTENIMFYVDLLMVAWRSLPTGQLSWSHQSCESFSDIV